MVRIQPGDLLRPYVESLWVSAGSAARTSREHSLPGGTMHLAIRLDAPLRLHAEAGDAAGQVVSRAVVAGCRARYSIKDTSVPTRSVGAVLRPGAARALLGCSAIELEGRHVPLELIWGAGADRLLERLLDESDPARQLERFAAALRSQLRPVGCLHPQVAGALQALGRGGSVADAVATSGCSHRHFIARFGEAVGLSPKRYARVRRFQRALQRLARGDALAEIALATGYSDQAHFTREFRELSGVTPRVYRSVRPASAQHLPVADPG
ncbi:helix-turn-helix transcriptional regulator [Marilutibacter chinensis]|uniref:Helix-turn-helix transcriptional regulator n=1 Tax=Marilutibacter chinensis TaxID=2912247 RepID=A0ABS9HSK3_9GAMM|nr:helix-turn-helix transcriptional regulator [Lysobacter chinensis]MCF7221905.1 helix-turn-helix transcriptional regulator [Lysobacter chinensis]